MEISRLIFSKETKKKMAEELTPMQKCKLRWERLKEAENHGSLSKAKNRYEVANLVGFSEKERAKGYHWVSDMVYSKRIQEIMLGMSKDGKMEYEYHVLRDPDYSRHDSRNKKINTSEAKTPAKEVQLKDKGKELFKTLKNLDKTGVLKTAKNRNDVAALVGYTEDRKKSGYSWVSSLISRGYLKEEITGINPSGYASYRYSLGNSEPKYDSEEAKGRKENKIESLPKENTPALDRKEVVNPDVIKINITRGGTNINVEVANCDQAIKLITTILKGEQK